MFSRSSDNAKDVFLAEDLRADAIAGDAAGIRAVGILGRPRRPVSVYDTL